MDDKIFTIYKVTNKINGHIYIGFSGRFTLRKSQHKHNFKHGKNAFHKAIIKYGWYNFDWEVIYESRDRDYTLNVMEPYFINLYSSNDGINGYNETPGGDGVKLDYWTEEKRQEHSEKTKRGMDSIEVKEKLSNSLKEYYANNPHPRKGISRSEEAKEKQSKTMKSLVTEETRDKCRQMSKEQWNDPEKRQKILDRVKNPSEKTRSKMSEAKKGKPSWNKGIPNTWSNKSKTYNITTPSGEVLTVTNLRKFAEENGLSQGTLHMTSTGKRKTHKGYSAKLLVV